MVKAHNRRVKTRYGEIIKRIDYYTRGRSKIMKRPKPYLRLIDEIDGYKVWLVDGNWIRTHKDIEFTNFGTHRDFFYIPQKELWIDKESSPNEANSYILHMLTKLRGIKKGLPMRDAETTAYITERNFREKYKDSNIYKKELGNNIYLVNGKAVRDNFLLSFTQGGHDKVYDFIPKNEIWIDDDLSNKERKYVILHELYERKLMNDGLNYDLAHRKANELEKKYRKDPTGIDKKIKEYKIA